MIIFLCVVAYLLMGLISEYMKGYANPPLQATTSWLNDWLSMLIWIVHFPSTVGNYGAARRISHQQNNTK